jgi:transcriptional regulator with XRE-family HTH domain
MQVVSDDEALKNISRNVAHLRGTRSYSELARQVGTFAANISKIEKGEHMPGAALLSRLAEALGVTADYLMRQHGSDKKSRRAS